MEFQAQTERLLSLRCSFTLHAPNGTRLMGFDNAHGTVQILGR